MLETNPTIETLLSRLPTQTEILRLEQTLARGRGSRIPLVPLAEIEASLPPRHRRAMAEIPELTRFFNPVELLTIDDVAGVRSRFLAAAQAGVRANPRFTYAQSTGTLASTLARHGLTIDAVEARLVALAAELREGGVEGIAGLVQSALLAKIDDDLATIELDRGLIARDDRAVKCAVAKKYGAGVDDDLLEAARVVYRYLVETRAHEKASAPGCGRIEPKLAAYMMSPARMSAAEFARAVEWMLARYYAHCEARTGRPVPAEARFRVVVDPRYSSIDVRDKSSEGPTIGIPAKDRSYKQYLELLCHEVDQHVRQSLNGSLMFGFGGGALRVDDETWYEGLAKHREIGFMRDMFGDESSPTLPYYTFAIRLADEGRTFVEVFEAIREMRIAAGSEPRTAAANAWSTAYRVFRGHSDTSNRASFGLPKDLAYLRGWMLHAQLEARGLSHLNEAAVSARDGLERIAQFEFGADELLLPDLGLAGRYFEEVLRPRLIEEMESR